MCFLFLYAHGEADIPHHLTDENAFLSSYRFYQGSEENANAKPYIDLHTRNTRVS